MGVEALSTYMVDEVQQVYRLQGVKLDNKHIEVVLRQMLQKVEIVDPGETTYLQGEQIDRKDLEVTNLKAIEEGYMTAVGIPVLQRNNKGFFTNKLFLLCSIFPRDN